MYFIGMRFFHRDHTQQFFSRKVCFFYINPFTYCVLRQRGKAALVMYGVMDVDINFSYPQSLCDETAVRGHVPYCAVGILLFFIFAFIKFHP